MHEMKVRELLCRPTRSRGILPSDAQRVLALCREGGLGLVQMELLTVALNQASVTTVTCLSVGMSLLAFQCATPLPTGASSLVPPGTYPRLRSNRVLTHMSMSCQRLRGLSPRADYTDRATSASMRS
jgi:hypothetical protein